MAHLAEAYSYEKDFDIDVFYSNYCANVYDANGGEEYLKFSLDCLHDTFKNGEIRGTLLDIGTGPTVHSVISASRHVTEVHLSDLLERVRDVLQKWWDGEPNVVPSFQYIIEMENDGSTLEDRTALTRGKVTRIYSIDLRLPEPLPDSRNRYDVITAGFTLHSVSKNKDDFKNAVGKVAAMLKPKGHLLMIGSLNCSFYTVGNAKFHGPNLSRAETVEVLRNAGFKIAVWREMIKEGYKPFDKSGTDADEICFACCRKL